MAVTANWYDPALLSVFNKETDADASSAMKVMLTTGTYTPDQDNDRYKSAVTNEVSSSGYTAGGYVLLSLAQSYTGATNVWAWDAADPSWTSVSFTTRRAVYYDSVGGGTEATRPLYSWLDFGADRSYLRPTSASSMTQAASGRSRSPRWLRPSATSPHPR